jgi:UDP-N-acetylmuramoyl-tripeptide--D-alanyl-D-alanine ligase
LGVPATLLDLNFNHEAAVVEMGMSALGEIKDLAMAVRPCVGIITAIGVSHIESLGSRENILKAKSEIIEGMPNKAPLLVCSDNDLLSGFSDDRVRVLRYATKDSKADIKAEKITVCSAYKTKFTIYSPWGSFNASIPALGEHNVQNALAAFAAGCLLDVLPEKAAQALSGYSPAGMRQKTVQYKDMTVVEDCYNASPDSLRAAVETLSNYPAKGRKILIVSDMLELGEEAAKMHVDCGAFAAASGIDRLMATGQLSKHTIQGAQNAGSMQATHFPDKKSLASALLSLAQPGDILWFKASRGMQLEEVIEEFYRGGAAL